MILLVHFNPEACRTFDPLIYTSSHEAFVESRDSTCVGSQPQEQGRKNQHGTSSSPAMKSALLIESRYPTAEPDTDTLSARCPAEGERRSRPRRPAPPRPGSSFLWGACCATSRGVFQSIASALERRSIWRLSWSISLVRSFSEEERAFNSLIKMMIFNGLADG